MKVDRKETLRYLGCRGQEIDSQTERLLNEVAEELERDSAPKSVYQEFPCKTEGDEVLIGGYRIKSANLAKNLEGCGYAVLLAATIGRAADFMVKKYSITNMAKAAITQAAGAAYIETYVDEVQASIQKEAAKRGLSLRPRFSPGYGDFALECQRELCAMLSCSTRIGLTLTEGNLMMPTKSVTALIGLAAKERESCQMGTCSQCGKIDCEFRTEESRGQTA